MTTPISAELREATKELHVQAERAGVMGGLLKGKIEREAYIALLSALHALYGGLEDALERNATHTLIAPLPFAGLMRRAALQHDLTALAGPAWRTSHPPHALAREYAAHLRALGEDSPARLIAHAWLRYLGDLAGGQIVARIVAEALTLSADETSFYAFPGLPDPRATAGAWKSAMDALPLTEAERGAIVAEACDGFRRHIALFEALV